MQSLHEEANHQAMSALLQKLSAGLTLARQGGGKKYAERHIQSGKLLPRQRIELLLDPDAWFLELLPLAGLDFDEGHAGAGLIGGIGVVSGQACLIVANEATLKGGAVSRIGVKKSLRLLEISIENRLPMIYLVESAGGDLMSQSDVFVPGGQTFRDISRRSKLGLPTISVVFGNSTAGGAYIPGMSDYVIMVKDQAKVFLAGPPLVKMATGEETDDESLGGASMHARQSGLADYLAESEQEALFIARQIASNFPQEFHASPWAKCVPPKKNIEDILGIVSSDFKHTFDQRDVITRLVDGSVFTEFKPTYGETLVCGFSQIHGKKVGILANNGVLFSEAANKGAQFIQLCNQLDMPLVFLQNITGFMVGSKYEQEGIIKNGAKLINAVSNCEVPMITIMTGASFGAGNYAMAGRSFAPRFLFTWPNHQIAIMGAQQLGGVIEIIKRDAANRKGETVDEEQLAGLRKMVELKMEGETNAFFATSQVWDDGIIDPRDTRTVLGIVLSLLKTRQRSTLPAFGVFRH